MIQLTICSGCFTQQEITPDGFAGSITDGLDRQGLAHRIRVRQSECMGVCANPVTIALQGEGMATCVFAGISPKNDTADIIAKCRAYLASPRGWIEDARPCGRLRFCLLARVPAPDGST